ncbi:MAG: tRNA lysidine(34) synthetase TilS, partial [Methylocapsa sp.]|nr:tRNA lysidine(34) synthetase TilS [Methylocapsa sp.]
AYSKAQLAAFCQARAHPFVTDPSNNDPAFARTRVRVVLGVLGQYGLDRAALLRLGRRLERAEAALAGRARAVREQLNARCEPGFFEADISALAGEADEIVLRILDRELELAGSGKPPRLERLEALTERLLQALRAGAGCKTTIGGALVQLKSGQTLTIVKEGARRRGRGIAFASPGDKVRRGPQRAGRKEVSLGKGENQA